MQIIGIKVKARSYILNQTLAEFGNSKGNENVYKKEETPQRVNIFFNRDLYLNDRAIKEIQKVINYHHGEVMTPRVLFIIESEILHFIKKGFSDLSCSFLPSGDNVHKISESPHFDRY